MIPLFAIFLGLALSHLAAGQSDEVPSAGSVLDLLQDPKYQPFIQIVSYCRNWHLFQLDFGAELESSILTRGWINETRLTNAVDHLSSTCPAINLDNCRKWMDSCEILCLDLVFWYVCRYSTTPLYAYLIHSFLEGILIWAIALVSRRYSKQWVMAPQAPKFLAPRVASTCSQRCAMLCPMAPFASVHFCHQFLQLEPGCSADLRDAFTKADGNIGKFASEYFDKCDSIDNSAQQMTSETSHGFTQKVRILRRVQDIAFAFSTKNNYFQAIITLFAFITFILVLWDVSEYLCWLWIGLLVLS